MFTLARRSLAVLPRVAAPVATRICGIHFTIKSFVDEFTTEEVEVDAKEGQTILEVAQENGASLNSFCGGNCRCGGCHIKMSQGITDILPKMTEQEKEALKKGIDVDESSRLACQTKVLPCMEGKIIVVPLAI
ncbi:hypothetical protein WA538_004542 [Blastocystis sp. DL]